MADEELRDYVEFEDEQGNTFELDLLARFEHEGDEYAILCDLSSMNDDSDEALGEDEELEQEIYIMKVVVDGDYEEFLPADEDKMDVLIELAQKVIDELDCDCDCDCDCDEDCDCEGDSECECGCGCHSKDAE